MPRTISIALLSFLLLIAGNVSAATTPQSESPGFLLPLACAELLPDLSPFTSFFESVGKVNSTKDRPLSLAIFRILALRDKLADKSEEARDLNPVDVLIRRTLCYYREQKDPTRPVTFDDTIFTQFLKGAIGPLEQKVNTVIAEWAEKKRQREDYLRKLTQNEAEVEILRKRADNEADSRFKQLSSQRGRKAGLP